MTVERFAPPWSAGRTPRRSSRDGVTPSRTWLTCHLRVGRFKDSAREDPPMERRRVGGFWHSGRPIRKVLERSVRRTSAVELVRGGRVWAHERLFAAARDRRRYCEALRHRMRSRRGRVIHRSARNGANGRIARDTCPSALPGNGKVRPEGYFVTSYPTGKVDVLRT